MTGPAEPKRLVLLARSLAIGGAEVQLSSLAANMPADAYRPTVVILYAGGELEDGLTAAGIPVLHADKHSRWDIGGFALRLARLLRDLKPDVLHSFLGPPNVLAALVRPVLRNTRLVWGVRASDMDLRHYDWTWRLTFRTECLLSRVPDAIVANSYAGRDHVVGHGFPAARTSVISNGIDVSRFRPDAAAGQVLRDAWLRPGDRYLVGFPARLDPMKDHETFLGAAARLSASGFPARFVCIGGGPEAYGGHLKRIAADLGLGDAVLWVGHVHDMVGVYNAVDVVALSSAFGEGFPNVVGEAMACGKPCVVTDVGDAAHVVGDTGTVVARRDPVVLADALESRLSFSARERADSERRARERIVSQFSTEKMVCEMVALYDDLLSFREREQE